jgi:hypothetical protein
MRAKFRSNTLQRRCQEAEQRSQDLSSSVPEATRPLLRQIESLQTGAVEKQRVWDQLEQQLRQRCADAESEARAAAQSETIASERLQHHQESLSQAEMRIMSLQVSCAPLLCVPRTNPPTTMRAHARTVGWVQA